MKIIDNVYGAIQIREPVLVELIMSGPVQRLKGINQAGARQFIDKNERITRYDHSVGVIILLKMLGASAEEQIAGLLHDIPHTAFSHVADSVFRSEKHDFHERFHKEVIMKSEIPEILRRYGYDFRNFLSNESFPLLERDPPDLCADRIDYTLRVLLNSYSCRRKIRKYLSEFIVHDNEIVMKNRTFAKAFAEDFIRMVQSWADPLEAGSNEILAKAIRTGIDRRVLSKDDLFKTDRHVLRRLKMSEDKDILLNMRMLNPKLKVVNDEKRYDFCYSSKARLIDPKFLGRDGSVSRVSEAYPGFARRMAKHRQLMEKKRFARIVSY